MIGMILCGGFGKRLKPITEQIPKGLIELRQNYTILDKQLLRFKNSGIEKVILLIGHMGQKIKERYGKVWGGLEIRYVGSEPKGTLTDFQEALKNVNEDVVLSNGDNVWDMNLKKFIQISIKSKFPATIYLTKMVSPYGIVEINDERVKTFREKPILDHYINAGVYFLKPEIFGYFMKFRSGDIERQVFPELATNGLVGYYIEDSFWAGVDTEKDLDVVLKEFKNRIDKPWGYEKIIVSTEKYLTKELYIMEGYHTSMHYHNKKDETLYIMEGSGYVEFDDGTRQSFSKNDKIRIKPKTIHSIVAIENTIIHEYSTPYPDDTIRVNDPYVRSNQNETKSKSSIKD